MENILKTAAGTAANNNEVVNKLYDDAIHPVAQNIGQALDTLSSTINVLLAPMSWAIYGFKIIDQKVKSSLERKLKDVPLDELTEPSADIVIPSYEALRYSVDKDELKDMYVSLLAASMVKATKDMAHPAFVEIIKQLSPFDAKLLKSLFYNQESSFLPKIKVRIQVSEHDFFGIDFYRCVLSNKYCPDGSLIEKYLFSIDNFERLKIITVDDMATMKPDNIYNEIIERINQNELLSLRDDLNYVNISKGSIHLTDFGRQFTSTVF